VILFRQYFGAYQAALFRSHTQNGISAGSNPYRDWWELKNVLAGRDRKKFFDGDFKRYDASEQPPIHWAVLDHINKWYDDGEENARIRHVLWLDLVHSRHIVGGNGNVVIQWNKSLPSGHPFTTIANSLYSATLLTACYILTTGRRDFWDQVGCNVLGDDNILGISDLVCEEFNQVTVAKHMADVFHMTYTSGAKDGTLVPYKPLEECTFLKRAFRRSDGQTFGGWDAPLDLKSLLYVGYYYKNNRDQKIELATKMQGSLGELSLHGPEVWDEWAPKLMDAIRWCGSEPLYMERASWRLDVSSRTDFWH